MNTRQSLQVIGSLFLFFGFVSGSTFLWIFGGFFLFLVVFQQWWLKNIQRFVTITLQADSTRVKPGTAVNVQVIVTNSSWMPLPGACIQFVLPEHVSTAGADEESLTNKRRAIKLWMNIPKRAQVERVVTITPTKRGMVWLREVHAELTSPYAMETSHVDFSSSFTLLVYPEVVAVPPITLGAAQPIGDRLARQRLQTDPTFMRGVRPYVAGDRIKHIDWKTSAKTLELQTKLFEFTAHPEWRIIGHILPSYEARTQTYNDELNERTISLIASLATVCRRNQTAYELLLSVRLRGHDFYRFAKGRGKQHHIQVMSHLARLHHFVPASPLPILHRIEQSRSKETILFVTPRLDDTLHAALQRLVRLGHEILILDASQELLHYQTIRPSTQRGVVSS